jgi:hypothetical protein
MLALTGWLREPLSQNPPKLRIQMLEQYGLVDEATRRAQALLGRSPDWLSDERTLVEAFVNYSAENERVA